MKLARALLLLLLLVVGQSGCLLVIVKYPDGGDPAGEMKIQWRATGSSTFQTIASAGGTGFACEPCFATPAPATFGSPEVGPTLPRVTFTPRPTLVTFTPTPGAPTPTPTPTRTPGPTASPTPTPLGPTPTPTPFGVTPTPVRTPTPTPTRTPSPVPTFTQSPKPSPTPPPGKVPCAGRDAKGMPPGAPIAQPGTLPNLNTYVEWRLTSEESPVSFYKVNARHVLRYDEVSPTLNQGVCTGDDTSQLLVLYVPRPPGGYADDLIYHRCFRVNDSQGNGSIFKDTAFCTGSNGWETCNNNEAYNASTLAIRPCSRNWCSTDTCAGQPFGFNGTACCACYVPNQQATNAFGESLLVPGADGLSPLVSKWQQAENGQWSVKFGWDFQAVGIPLGGADLNCCPACGGFAAGTKQACYCRVCVESGGAAVGSGCVPTLPTTSAPWFHYANFFAVDQFSAPYDTVLKLSDVAASFDVRQIGTATVMPKIDGGSGFFDFANGTTFWWTASWQQARPPGSKMPACTEGVTPCQFGQTSPLAGNCDSWCDPGITGTCVDTTTLCYKDADCQNTAGRPAVCRGGQSNGIQVDFGANAELVYGVGSQDPNHDRFGGVHGTYAEAVQGTSRLRFDSETMFLDPSLLPAPWTQPRPSSAWRRYLADVTGIVSLAKLFHVKNAYGCGGPTSEGGTGYTGTCNFEQEPTKCAKSCVAPGQVGHTGPRCFDGACYQFMFSELTDLTTKPATFTIGSEGGWATKNVLEFKNILLGARNDILP